MKFAMFRATSLQRLLLILWMTHSNYRLGTLLFSLSLIGGCDDGGGGDSGGDAGTGNSGASADGPNDDNGSSPDDDGSASDPGTDDDANDDDVNDDDASESGDTDGPGTAEGEGSGGGESNSNSDSDSDSTSGGTGGGLECGADGNEPNDGQGSASFLGALSDDDDDAVEAVGELAGIADNDWFTYNGSDDLLNAVDPTVTVAAEGGVTLCQYAECNAGAAETVVTCPSGTVEDTSTDGSAGCCQEGADGFTLGLSCPGLSDDATISFSLEAEADACIMYTLDVHY